MRSRVHALNILRLIILDAPLAKAVGPIIGDSLVAAIIGYNDDAWGVRNSSTMVFAAIMLRAIDADKNASNTDATSNNAITFGELFRSYPSLSPFLLSLLRAAAADQLETHHGIPPIFPILLLLSRVQPVANSGPESAEQTAVFIPGVFASLSHRNDGIRKTASLALINLCSGDHAQSPTSASAMFNGCHALLVNAAKDRDWNSFHGALLGLKELAQSFSGIGQTFREAGLNRYFLRLCMLKGSILEIPPLCLSVVLSILAAQPDCWNDVEEVCRYLVDTIEEVVNIEISGLSDLAATAANLLADRVAQKIWSIQLGQNDLDSLLTIVSKLMGCEVIDVRLHASKAMKKAIYDNIDQLLVSTEVSCDTQRLRLAAISRIFLVSLRTELQRDAGAHPPTLRRHSRCLLECVAAYERLSQEVNASPLARLDLLDEFQDTAESLMSLDQCTEDSDIRGETQLTGNSVELLSFAIADIIRHTETVQEDLVRKFEKFASLIKRLNDPSLSWRLRHSAAMSVYNSHLLGWNIGDGQQIDERMTGIKQVMLEEVLVMLQDSDPDVRRAAGQAAYSIHDLKQTGEKSLFPSVSQRVLEQTYDYAYQRNRYRLALKENRAYFEQLLKAIETRCEYFAGKLSILEGELRQTMASAGLDNLLNTGTVRKIFEDEVANPYEESALANQLAVRKLLDFEIKSETNNNCSASSAIFFQCEKVLRAIKENIQSNTDFLHDLTRSNSVFADIHSLLVATAAILFLFGGDAGTGEHLKRIANDILESAAAPTMHPCILKALNSLAAVEPKSLVSRKDIRECLFLIPGSLSTEQGK